MVNGADSPRGLSYSYDDGAGATTPPTSLGSATMTSSAAGAATSHASPLLHISTTTSAASPSSHSPAGNAHSTTGSPSPRGSGTGGGSGSTNQACAACKYQRRKCNPDCPLAPYFPADQQRRFLRAHRLFGVSNILKTFRRLRPELCAEAMSSLIFQAEMRAQDPVGGCYHLILTLERQLEVERAELAALLHHLALCRHQQSAGAMPPRPEDLDVTSSNHQPILLNADQEVIDALCANHQDHPHEDQGGHSPQHHGGEQQQLFDYFYYDTAPAGDDASSGKPVTFDINVDAMHQFDYDDDRKVDMVAPAAVHEQQQHLDVNCHIDHNEYEMKAASLLADVFDMRQAVDVNAGDGIDVEEVGVNVNINIDINAVDVNAEVGLNEEL